MKYRPKRPEISKNEGSRIANSTRTKKWAKENWFKSQLEDLIKLYELLPKSWLQRVYFYELFLIIGDLDGDPQYGITDYFEMLKTRNCTAKTLSTFLNDRIADGDLILVQSLKQSRKTYRLNPKLKKICHDLAR